VTGANRGIGLALVRQLKDRGDEVIAACRKSSDELDATGVRVETGLDVADSDAVQSFAKRLGDTKIDVLINNAGVLESTTLSPLDEESIRKQFEINSLGPLRVTSALLPNLSEGSKVALVTSRMGSIGDNTSGGAYGYRMSKAALNIAGVSLARDLAGQKIAVALLHPGMVATDMTARFGHGPNSKSPEAAAAGLIARIDELTPENSGKFWHGDGPELPW
jgi:NAD(P)-dependent dehydrogenase (short-subunit alcohol dehydrogenase family)